MAELRIRHDDIAFVGAGQPVKLEFAAYPFQKCGMLEGAVRTIAPDMSNAASRDSKSPGPADLGLNAVVALDTQQLQSRGQPFVLNPACRLWPRSAKGSGQ
jgi:HlyD family secretion protein